MLKGMVRLPKQSEGNDTLQIWYGRYRRYLAAVAYRMLGSWSEAEDVAQDVPQEPIDLGQGRELTMRFLHAAQTGRVEELLTWLTEDAVCWSDGGGVVEAATRPLFGADRAAAFLIGLAGKIRGDDKVQLIPLIVNGEAGFGVLENGLWTTVITVEWRGDKVKHLYMIRNPHKLKHLNIPREKNT